MDSKPNEERRGGSTADEAGAADAEADRLEKLERTLEQINCIRDSIIGHQNANISAHIYPLVQALNEAGFKGVSYEEARKQYVQGADLATNINESGYEKLRKKLEPLGLFCGSLGSVTRDV